jgi:hypothetical protein
VTNWKRSNFEKKKKKLRRLPKIFFRNEQRVPRLLVCATRLGLTTDPATPWPRRTPGECCRIRRRCRWRWRRSKCVDALARSPDRPGPGVPWSSHRKNVISPANAGYRRIPTLLARVLTVGLSFLESRSSGRLKKSERCHFFCRINSSRVISLLPTLSCHITSRR